MKYKQEREQIDSAIASIKTLDIKGTPPYNVLTKIENVDRNLKLMKLDVSKMDIIKHYEPILIDLRIKLEELQIYHREPDSEIRKNKILRILDQHITNFKDVGEIKRQTNGLEKQDKEINLAEDAKKIAKWAIVIACVGTLVGMFLTLLLHFI